MFEDLGPHYRHYSRYKDFVTIYRLGARKRDSCQRAYMQFKDRPFSLETALKFFHAQRMIESSAKETPNNAPKVPLIGLDVPEQYVKRDEPSAYSLKGNHYLWVQDKKAQFERMVTDEAYRARAVDSSEGFDLEYFSMKQKIVMENILTKTILENANRPKANPLPENYLNRLLKNITTSAPATA